MFIVSVRANTIRFFALLFAGVFLLCGALLFFLPRTGAATEAANYAGVKTEEDRRAFLASFGWEVSGSPVEVGEFTVPAEFDRVLTGYNEIQRAQGLDLSRYARKTVTRYTYEVTNYKGYDGKVYANVIVYRNRVVAGDLCAANGKDFVVGFGG